MQRFMNICKSFCVARTPLPPTNQGLYSKECNVNNFSHGVTEISNILTDMSMKTLLSTRQTYLLASFIDSLLMRSLERSMKFRAQSRFALLYSRRLQPIALLMKNSSVPKLFSMYSRSPVYGVFKHLQGFSACQAVVFFRVIESTVAVVVFCVYVSPGPDQQGHSLCNTTLGGHYQRRR